MPYMPYSRVARGKNIWPTLKPYCSKCRVQFITKNPNKNYCSEKCRRADEMNRRRERKAAARDLDNYLNKLHPERNMK